MALNPLATKTNANGDVVVGVAAGQSIAATQGTAAANSAAWFVKITDGADDATVVANGDSATGQKGLVALAAKANTAAPAPSDGTLTYLSVDTAGALRVTGAGGGTQYAEDAASANADLMMTAGTVRQDTPAGSTSTDGDYQPLKTDSVGRLHVNVGAIANVTLAAGTNTNEIVGDVAQDAPISGNPVSIGGRASAATPTAMSADGDSVYTWLDRSGAQVVNGRDAHDAPLDANSNPALIGGHAKAAAPTDVSADGDAVKAWFLRNGAQAAVLTAAGALIGGDAANGLDVDVTRVTGTVTVDSELPAAAALADATANPTVPTVGADMLLYNGATWDRVRGDTSNGVDVDVTRLPALVASTAQIGKITVSDGTDDANVAASNAVAAVKGLEVLPAICNSAAPSLTDGRSAALSLDTTGQLRVAASATATPPTNPLVEYLTTAALAAAGSVALDGTEIGAVTKKLRKLHCTATGAARFELRRQIGSVVDTNPSAVGHVSAANPNWMIDFPTQDWVTLTGTAGTVDKWRVTVFNIETSGGPTIDAYITLYHAES